MRVVALDKEVIRVFLQQVINGLVLGGTYALVAIGYTLIFGVLRVLHLAHGEVFMAGAFAGLLLMTLQRGGLALALAGSVGVGVGVGLAIQAVALNPLRRSENPLAPIISTLAVGIILQDLAIKAFGAEQVGFPEIVQPRIYRLGPTSVSDIDLFILAVCILLVGTLQFLLRRTRLGAALRASAESQTLSSLLGIRVGRMATFTVVLASALAGAGGLLIGLANNAVSPFMGFEMTVKGLVVMLFGGVGSVVGALLGGLILGMAEVLSVAYLASTYRDAFAFLLLIAIILARPQGLFGSEREGA